VAIIATDGFEALELIEPFRALSAEGGRVDVIAPIAGTIQGMHQHHKTIRIEVDRVIGEAAGETVLAEQYDALVLPGGPICADTLRTNLAVRRFVLAMNGDDKPIASISHAAWILISAGIVSERRITAFHNIADDLRNAGAHWIDAPVVIDNNLISTRGIKDLAEFDIVLVDLLSRVVPLISPEMRQVLAKARFA
jgi:protease I